MEPMRAKVGMGRESRESWLMQARRQARSALFWLRLLLGLGALGLIITRIDLASASMQPTPLILAALAAATTLLFMSQAVAALRWRIVLGEEQRAGDVSPPNSPDLVTTRLHDSELGSDERHWDAARARCQPKRGTQWSLGVSVISAHALSRSSEAQSIESEIPRKQWNIDQVPAVEPPGFAK